MEDSTAMFARKFSVPDSIIMDRIDMEISGAIGRGGGENEERVGNVSLPKFEMFRPKRERYYARLVERFDLLTKQTLQQQGYSWSDAAFPQL